MSDNISARFDKLEEKIDKLSDAMVSMARSEEKILAIQEQVGNQTARLNRLSEKLDNVEKVSLSNAFTSKIVWVILTAVIGSVVSMVMGII